MATRKVTVIPPTINPLTRISNSTVKKRRTAGYARVSTDKDEQFTSYEAQIDYYTSFIKNHSDWEFVKVYTDEGISGLNTKKRDGFNEMISDALAGKIDLIITKSVSRFARNTVDSLVTIRKLKDKGVEVYFEKENIWTFDSKGELLLTIMSSLAQEESRSISENVTWGQRKRFSDGKVSLPYKHFLGYERGENKGDPPVVNEEQAKLVRRIYHLFMSGKTTGGIARILTAENIPTPSGKKIWQPTTIESILKNEKYKGAARLQKKFTVDFLSKKMKINEGEVPQYYIENSHEAILDPMEWDAVQDEFKRRKAIGRAYSGKSVLGAKIVCGDCGGFYGSKTWHSTDKYKTVIWQCNRKFKNNTCCKTPHITEDEINKRFLKVYNGLISDKEPFIKACKLTRDVLTDTKEIDREMSELLRELEVVTELMKKCIAENSSSAQDQEEYTERYNSYVDRYEKAKSRYDELEQQKENKLSKRKTIDRFISDLSKRDELLTEFDNCLWLTVVDTVTIRKDGTLVFKFNDGTEIEG